MHSFRQVWLRVTSSWGKAETEGGPSRSQDFLRKVSDASPQRALRLTHSTEYGLREDEIQEHRRVFGENRIAYERPPTALQLLFSNFHNPFILVLLLLALISYLTDDLKGTIVVSAMVAVSVVMRFIQEFRSSRSAEALKAMVKTTATVTRRLDIAGARTPPVAQRREIAFDEIVSGDLVQLSAGDMVPADLRLLQAKDLFVSEASLTGESLPAEKYSTLEPSEATTASDGVLGRRNLCFMGTNVVSGTAVGVVVAVGERTVFGSLAKSILGKRTQTSFDKGVNSVTWLLVRFMAVMVPVVFLLNGYMKGSWTEAFLFAIAVAVGLTPEMLPMVVTANLAKGANAMAKKKVIVKRLNSIQNLGAMDVLCTDKTGTLTEDKIILEEHLDVAGADDSRVLKYAYVNSYYQTGLKNLLDRAVLTHYEMEHELRLPDGLTKIDEIPFDFVRKRMSVVVAGLDKGPTLVCKGAVEEILQLCSNVSLGAGIQQFSPLLRDQALALVKSKNEIGFRVVAVAFRALPKMRGSTLGVQDECGLTLLGFIAFLDPPKESSAEAIARLRHHGVRVKVLTGDGEIVTLRVCREVGVEGAGVLLGSQIENMGDEELGREVERVNIFAKLAPAHKARIVRALKAAGHTVGFMGDGINDAPALREADVGISVDTATDIARESADIILLEKNLLVLDDGVRKGREIYGNIIKYIKMTASSNFGNVFSVLIASAFIPFLPMLPVQLLVQNLLYDFSQTSLPWDRMDEDFLLVPRKWEPGGIARFMLYLGPVSSLFDVVTFLVLWYVLKANTPERAVVFQTGWFVEGLLSQTLVVHMIRTQKIPFVQSRAAWGVMAMTAIIMGTGVLLTLTPPGRAIGLVPLPGVFYVYLAGILLLYCGLAQVVKMIYMQKFRQWL